MADSNFPTPGGFPTTGDFPTTGRFLTTDASDDELLAATAANHIDWLYRLARASNGTVSLDDGVHWTYVSRRNTEVTAAIVDPPGPGVRAHLDELLEFCRGKQVDRVGYWAFSTDYRSRLGTWLGARGFRFGGRPHWMSLDLQAMGELPTRSELTAETGFSFADRFTALAGTELPCFDPDTAHVRQAMAAERPQRVWHVIQWDGDAPVGQVSIDVTTGDLGVCGLHDTVIMRSNRIKGLGIKRLLWVCRFAQDLGCRYVITNAAAGNGPLFGIWGFRTLGFGQTWWLPGPVLQVSIASDKVAFAEAIGEGDLAALEALSSELTAADLDAALPNGMTPLQFAGATQCEASFEWLQARGAQPDVLAAWDLGWKATARQLLETRPDLLQARRPRSGKTLLHVAVERDDVELVELLLAAGIDTSATDNRFGRTALEWARELRRAGAAVAIKRHK